MQKNPAARLVGCLLFLGCAGNGTPQADPDKDSVSTDGTVSTESENDAPTVPSGELLWVTVFGGAGFDSGRGLALLPDRSFVTVGQFSDESAFGPPDSPIILNSIGLNDGFVGQFDQTGQALSAIRAGGSGEDGIVGVTTVGDEMIAIIGAVRAEGDLNSQPIPSGEEEAFFALLTVDGVVESIHRIPALDPLDGLSIASNTSDQIAIAGRFDKAAHFDGIGDVPTTAQGLADGFLAIYSTSGSLENFTAVRGQGSNFALAVTALPDGGFVFCGSYEEEAQIIGGGSSIALPAAQGRDGYIVAINSDGSPAWANSFGGEGDDSCRNLTTGLDGRIIATGVTGSHASFPSSGVAHELDVSPDAIGGFVTTIDSTGSVQTLEAFSATGILEPNGVVETPDGNIAVSGHFAGRLLVKRPTGDDTQIATTSRSAVFVGSINSEGGFDWVSKQAEGPESNSRGFALMASSNGLIVTGGFENEVTFASGLSNEKTVSARGCIDGFVLELAY